jgi:hypothetical protein
MCPGWMFVPRKPHLFGNEYHYICCADTMIMYAIEIVEGADAGDAIDEHMVAKEVGGCDSLPGTLDGISYDLFVLKDLGYTMKIMSTYGCLLVMDGQIDSIRNYQNAAGKNVTKKLKYTKPFANHFLYRHCVDDHNHIETLRCIN